MNTSDEDPLLYLSTLAAIANKGSFSRAADALGLNRAAISKRVRRMELALGVPVLSRTTRRVELTQAGMALLGRHAQAQALLLQGVDEARGAMSGLGGKVRVACASSSLAVHLIGPALLDFVERHPNMSVDLSALLNDRAGTPADIELRITDEPPQDRAARPLAKLSWTFCATKEYVKRHGAPRNPADFLQHQLVMPASHDRPATFENRLTRETVTVRPNATLTSDVQEVVYELVKRGSAIGLLPNYLHAANSRKSPLVQVLPQWRLTRLPAQTLYAIHPAAKYQRAATRAVLDHLLSVCASLSGPDKTRP